MQTAAPGRLNVPTPQKKHEDELGAAAAEPYLPAAQGRQELAPEAEYAPASQLVQDSAPAALYVPAAQAAQAAGASGKVPLGQEVAV